MRFLRHNRYLFVFLALLVFCSAMIIRQLQVIQSRPVELREAFVLLYIKGYRAEAERIYNRMIRDVHKLSDRQLMDDFQRTLLLVDPTSHQPENLIWNYHWTVSNELEKRSESTLLRALKLAGQQ